MKLKYIITISLLCSLMTGCGVMQQLEGAYNLTQCKYEYNSLSNLSLAGINLSEGVSIAQVPRVASALTGKASSIPINFTVNMNVNNPNKSAAIMNGFQYILNIDDIQFTTGNVSQMLNVPAGGRQTLPLTIGFDLKQLISGEFGSSAVNIIKNFVGIGDTKSKVTLQLKPTFLVAGQSIASPVYIPISFSFGGN